MERENHKFEKEVARQTPEVLVPNQVIRVEHVRWKKRHLLAALMVGAGAIFLARKLRNKP